VIGVKVDKNKSQATVQKKSNAANKTLASAPVAQLCGGAEKDDKSKTGQDGSTAFANRNSFWSPETIQGKFEGGGKQLKSAPSFPTIQLKNTTGLPDNVKSNTEKLSGVSLSDVHVHYNSDKPAQLHAHAYAQGTDIHVAPGQEKHVPHEAWHVVQQKQGRVQATTQMKGKVPVNDDAGLEKEADVMGAKAVQMASMEEEEPVQQKAISNHGSVAQLGAWNRFLNFFGMGKKEEADQQQGGVITPVADQRGGGVVAPVADQRGGGVVAPVADQQKVDTEKEKQKNILKFEKVANETAILSKTTAKKAIENSDIANTKGDAAKNKIDIAKNLAKEDEIKQLINENDANIINPQLNEIIRIAAEAKTKAQSAIKEADDNLQSKLQFIQSSGKEPQHINEPLPNESNHLASKAIDFAEKVLLIAETHTNVVTKFNSGNEFVNESAKIQKEYDSTGLMHKKVNSNKQLFLKLHNNTKSEPLSLSAIGDFIKAKEHIDNIFAESFNSQIASKNLIISILTNLGKSLDVNAELTNSEKLIVKLKHNYDLISIKNYEVENQQEEFKKAIEQDKSNEPLERSKHNEENEKTKTDKKYELLKQDIADDSNESIFSISNMSYSQRNGVDDTINKDEVGWGFGGAAVSIFLSARDLYEFREMVKGRKPSEWTFDECLFLSKGLLGFTQGSIQFAQAAVQWNNIGTSLDLIKDAIALGQAASGISLALSTIDLITTYREFNDDRFKKDIFENANESTKAAIKAKFVEKKGWDVALRTTKNMVSIAAAGVGIAILAGAAISNPVGWALLGVGLTIMIARYALKYRNNKDKIYSMICDLSDQKENIKIEKERLENERKDSYIGFLTSDLSIKKQAVKKYYKTAEEVNAAYNDAINTTANNLAFNYEVIKHKNNPNEMKTSQEAKEIMVFGIDLDEYNSKQTFNEKVAELRKQLLK
jgi:hypothetical protein